MEQKGGDRVKKDCLNCMHKKRRANTIPCRNCKIVNGEPSKWRAECETLDENGLLPCPFCGGKARLHSIGKDGAKTPAYIDCESCFCGTAMYDIKPDGRDNIKIVVEKWNRRAAE